MVNFFHLPPFPLPALSPLPLPPPFLSLLLLWEDTRKELGKKENTFSLSKLYRTYNQDSVINNVSSLLPLLFPSIVANTRRDGIQRKLFKNIIFSPIVPIPNSCFKKTVILIWNLDFQILL